VAFLEAISAPDLGILVAGKDFAAMQDMTEEFGQDITWRGAFGSDGPVLRTIRRSDENTVRFSAIILKSGADKGMNDESKMLDIRDFDVQVSRGNVHKTYRGCNWRRISINSTLDQVTIDVDISVPGFVRN
jgi:hypothetical protein